MDTRNNRPATATLFFSLLILAITIFSLPSYLFAAREASGEAQALSGAIWEVELSASDQEGRQLAEVMARKQAGLAEKGLALRVLPGEGGSTLARVNGTGADRLREFLFKGLSGEAGMPAGPVSMQFTGRAVKDRSFIIALQANPSTGYSWRVVRPHTSSFIEERGHNFEAKTGGLGSPVLQRISLKAREGGLASIKLAYVRASDPDESTVARVTMSMSGIPGTIDLGDPSAAAPVPASASSNECTTPLPALLDGLPAYFDWREHGGESKIKDQKTCGSCWAFATTAILESALRIKYGFEFDLSEQFLVSCNMASPKWSCNGGLWAHDYHLSGGALGNLQTVHGAVLEKDMPYKASDQACKTVDRHPFWMTDWGCSGSLVAPLSPIAIKNLIYRYGPVTASICAGSYFNEYKGGVFDIHESSECSNKANHAVVLMGWDDVTGTWILKNSWGTKWGQRGYMDIKWGISLVGTSVSYLMDPYVNCTYNVSPANRTVSYPGATVTLTVSTPMLCPPPVVRIDDPWVTLVGQTWNDQRGTVRLKVLANGTSLTRTSGVMVGTNSPDGGTLLPIKQSPTPCRITSVTPRTQTFANGVGDGSLDIKTNLSDCEWTVSTFHYWIGAAASGAGSQTLTYTVDPNATGKRRTGKITTALKQNSKKMDVTVNQAK